MDEENRKLKQMKIYQELLTPQIRTYRLHSFLE